MQCPFCAETIQDQAVLCRFCGATKEGEGWAPPGPKVVRRPPGYLTIRIAAGFFFLSAAFELVSITSAVPLFGDVRTGAVAGLYHLVFVGLFVAMGLGLWMFKAWGPNLIYGGTAFYTIERILYIADSSARKADLAHQARGFESLTSLIDFDALTTITTLVALTSVACWWGFAAYIYVRRDNFSPSPRRPER